MKNIRRSRLIALLLCVLMVLSLVKDVSYYPMAENESTDAVLMADGATDVRELNKTEVKIYTYVNGVETELTDTSVLKNGDKIKVVFNWTVSNLDNNITKDTDLTYALGASGVAINNFSGSVYDANVPVGTFRVDEAGVLHVSIYDEEMLTQNDLKGGVSIDAVIDVSGLQEDENGKVTVEIADETITVQKKDPTPPEPSNVAPGISKGKSGMVYSKDGKNYLDYTVTINVNSDADTLTFTDTMGSALALAGNSIKVDGSDVTPSINNNVMNYTFSDVKKGDVHTITYTVEVGDIAFGDYFNWENTAALTNKAEVKDSNDNSASAETNTRSWHTWIEKRGGNYNAQDKTIEWTIEVNKGDAIDISGAVVTDTIPEGLEITGDVTINGPTGSTTISGADFAASGYTFPDGSVGAYTIRYKTTVTEGVSGLNGVNYTNVANIKDDRYNVDETAAASVRVSSGNWVDKSFVSADVEGKQITWQTKITVPEGQITPIDITYVDELGNGLSYVEGSMTVDGVAWDGSVELTGNTFKVPLGAVTGPKVITITYVTDFEPGDSKNITFTNRGYVSDGIEKSNTDDAQYQYREVETEESEIDILKNKNAVQINGTEVRWQIGVSYSGTDRTAIMDAIKDGKRVLIYDTLSFRDNNGRELDWKAKGAFVDGSVHTDAGDASLITTTVDEDGTIIFDITDYLAAPNAPYYFNLSYVIKLDDDTVAHILNSDNINTIREYNSADAYLKDTAGDLTDIGDVQDNNGAYIQVDKTMLNKSYTYNSSTAPYADYEIVVNPNGYKLIEGDGTLTLTDTLGADLQLQLSSVAIMAIDGSDISAIKKSYDDATRTLTVTNIPDGVPLRLTYSVFVDVPYEDNKSFESLGADVSNKCSLFAESEEVASKNVVITGSVQDSNAWATSDYGAVMISKYTAEELKMLEGAEFEVTAYKYDIANNEFVENPNYATENPGMGLTIGNVVTDANGAKTVRLLFDTLYKIEEVKAPYGYVKGDNSSIYVLIQGQDYADIADAVTAFEAENGITVNKYTTGSYVYVENEPGYSIYINKKDQDGKSVAGAEFTLYKKDAAGEYTEVIGTKESDEDGRICFALSEAGDYKIVETKAPDGYTGTFSKEFTLNENNVTVTYDVENEKQLGSCNIVKTGSDGKLLEGVEFGLYDNDELVSSAKTDAAGKISFENLELNKEYTVEEITGIYGYNLDTTKWTFTLTSDNLTKAINAVNTKQDGKIKIYKRDSADNTTPIANVVFTLYDAQKKPVLNADNKPVTVTTDANGEAVFEGLPYDTYYIRETAVPDDYMLDDTFVECIVTNDTELEISVVNEKRVLKAPYFSFKVIKHDAATNNPLPGAVFKLYVADGNSEVLNEANLAATAISGADGVVYFLNINNDAEDTKYTLVETSAPYGYYCSTDNMYVFSLDEFSDTSYTHDAPYSSTDSDLANKVHVLFDYGALGLVGNYAITGEIKLTKTDAATSELLSGAVYGAYKNGVQVAVGTTDTNGVITFTGLAYNDTYTIKEIIPPAGYKLSNDEFTVIIGIGEDNVTDDGVYQYEIDAVDEAIDIIISKKSMTGTDELAGAALSLYNANGDKIESWVSSDEAHTITAVLSVNSIYELVEDGAPVGYGYCDSIKFRVNEDGTITVVSINDEYVSVAGSELTMLDKEISFNLIKKDAQGNLLSGAELSILSSDGRVIYGWTDSNEQITSETIRQYNLPISAPSTPGEYNEYIFHEETAPSGYLKADDIPFYIDYYGDIYLKNADGAFIKTTDNQIVMVDETDDSFDVIVSKVKGTENGTELAGAKLVLTDKEGQVVEEWITTSTAKVFDESALHVGEMYTLTELEAPEGYTCAAPITFVINDDKQVVIDGEIITGNHIYMSDTALDVDAGKKDGNNYLSGAVIVIYDKSGSEVISYTTGAASKDLSSVLKAGYKDSITGAEIYREYTMHEAQAPFGYAIADDIKFAIDMAGNVYIYNNGNYEPQADNEIIMHDEAVNLNIKKLDEAGDLLDGAELCILDNNGAIVGESWTSSDVEAAEFNMSLLKPHVDGTDNNIYILHEVAAPYGYAKADDIEFYVDGNYKLYVKAGDSFVADADGVLDMTDSFATITVSKVDITNSNELAGASLTIKDSAGTAIVSWTSSADKGKEIDVLKFAPNEVYTLTETSAPYGYELAESIEFKLDEYGVLWIKDAGSPDFVKATGSTVVMEDAPKYISISKLDFDDNTALAGADMKVVDSTGNTVASWTSGATAYQIHLASFVADAEYELVEVKAPAGYGYCTPIKFKVNALGAITLISQDDDYVTVLASNLFVLDKAMSFKLIKKDALGNLLSGATLQIKSPVGAVIYEWTDSEAEITGELITANGLPISAPGTPGVYNEYIFHEETAPSGYLKAADIPFYIDCYGDIYLKNEDGEYVKTADNQIVMVDEIDNNDVIVSKVKGTENGTELAGAKLVITDSTGAVVEEWTTTDVAKVLDKSLFSVGETYTLTELEAPEGYACASPITFTINSEKHVVIDGEVITGNHIYMSDAALDVELGKKVENAYLSGAVIVIYDESGDEVITYTSGAAPKDLSAVLKAGYKDSVTGDEILRKYTMHETQAPFGYAVADDIEFALDMAGNIYINNNGSYELQADNEIIMYDEAMSLNIIKLDEDGALLEDAELCILDNSGNIVGESWISSDAEAAEFNMSLLKPHVDGDNNIYTLRELTAPYGYAVADDIEFYMDRTGKLYVKVGNSFVADADGVLDMIDAVATVTISKVDITNSNELAGASLVVKDGMGNVVVSWTSSADKGKEIDVLDLIPDEIYTLTETTAPYGYELAESIEFKLDAEGNLWVKDADALDFVKVNNGTVVMKDAPKYVGISKVDLDDNTALSGASLKIVDGLGNTVDSWTSNGKVHQIAVAGLTADAEYKLVETKAPDGYELADDIVFKVDSDGKLYIKGEDGNFTEAVNGIVVMKDEASDDTDEETTEGTTEEEPDDNTPDDSDDTPDGTTSDTTEVSTETPTTGTDTPTDINTNTDTNAQTGDRAPIAVVITLMLMSALGFAFAGMRKRRN